MSGRYILDDNNNPIPCNDLITWGRWPHNRQVRNDIVGDVRVSTVFLGLDYSFGESNEHPILWETMIFGGEHDQYQERYSSLKMAIEGHEKALKLVQGA